MELPDGVTREMVSAGVWELMDYDPAWSPHEYVIRVYQAMKAVRLQQLSGSHLPGHSGGESIRR